MHLRLKGRNENETGENCIMRSFRTCTAPQLFSVDDNKEAGIGGACGTYGAEDKCAQYFGSDI
jgi:hypothetical protein